MPMRGRIALGFLIVATAIALNGAGRTAPAVADGPGSSFSVDVNPSVAGIQTSRTVPLGSLFTVSVWLDNTNLPQFIEIDIRLHYDDFRLTIPASTFPNDWKDATVLDTTSGTSAPWPAPWECAPDPPTYSIIGEDGIGTASIT